MVAFAASALFLVVGSIAVAIIVATIRPYRARIACLLVHGTQSRLTDLPPLPARRGERATPRLVAAPVHWRAAA